MKTNHISKKFCENKIKSSLVIVLLLSSLFSFTIQTRPLSAQEDFSLVHKQLVNTELDTTTIAKVHLPFIENVGQSNEKVRFYANTFAGTVFVTDDYLTYAFSGPKSEDERYQGVAIRESFLDGSQLHPTGLQKSESVVSYFVGQKENWKSNIPTYDKLSLGEIWPSVDVSLKAYGNNVEKIFTVHPDGKVDDIKLGFEGISELYIDNGDLLLVSELGKISMTPPVAFQNINNRQVGVDVSYYVDGTTYGFKIGKYDPRYDLIIDPLLASTFLGGDSSDSSSDIALDSSGNVFVTGFTLDSTTDLPTTIGAYDQTHNGSECSFFCADAFVSKFNNNLTTLLASTFLGGSGSDIGSAITLDSSGNVYVAGQTFDFPTDLPTTTGAFDESHNGNYDAFVSKFNNNLTTLLASTFLGGSTSDGVKAMTLDSSGNVFVTGLAGNATTSFPTTTGAFDESHNSGNNDAFVSKFNSDLTTLLASTFLGGLGDDGVEAMTLDSSGNVFVTGLTSNSIIDLPTTTGAFDESHNGNYDAFVSKFNNNLTTLLASTFLGGSGADGGSSIALDSSGNVYVTGRTFDSTTDYPTTTGAFDESHNGNNDAFVSKFNNNLTTLLASTFLGGSGGDGGSSIALDSSGNVYVAGQTFDSTTDLPTTTGAFDESHNGNNDAFVSKFNNNLTTLLASTFLGGSGGDGVKAMTLDSSGSVYVTGQTVGSTTNFPTTPGAYDTTPPTLLADVFVSRLTSNLLAINDVTVDLDKPSYFINHAGLVTVTAPSANTDSGTQQIISANVNSDADPVGITVTLTETGNNNGIFVTGNYIVFTSGASDQSTSRLHVVADKPVTATYSGQTDTATILSDAALPPVIGDPVNVGERETCALWTDDSPDGDGICTDWENLGFPGGLSVQVFVPDRDGDGNEELIIYDYTCDAANPCPSPSLKDIYVEIDYMKNHRPSDAAINLIKTAFSDRGITLHVQIDDEVGHQNTISWSDATGASGFDQIKDNFFGTLSERTTGTSQEINDRLTAKRQVFHYVLFAHDITNNIGTSGTAETPGNDILVTLGSFTGGTGSVDQQAGTLMHELGHNLDLLHGGPTPALADIADLPNRKDNCKPNHLSVMSYSRQFAEFVANRELTYSRMALANLDENNLDENVGVQLYTLNSAELTAYGPAPIQTTTTGVSVNWNRLGGATDTGVQANINDFDITGCNSDEYVGVAPLKMLKGYEDWSKLKYYFRDTNTFDDGMHTADDAIPELTIDIVTEFRLAHLDRLDQAIQDLPDTAFVGDPTLARTTLHNDIVSADDFITQQDLDGAVAILQQLRTKMDGSVGGNASDDLIVSSFQGPILEILDSIISSYTIASEPAGGHLISPQEIIADAINDIQELVDDGVLDGNQANSLITKLNGAIAKLDAGNTTPACNQLDAFVNEVNALVNSGRLTGDQGETLTAAIGDAQDEICQ